MRLVYEALAERQRLRKNAPHLVKILPFLIPIFSKDGLINSKVARAMGSAMWMYDLTGGARIGKLHKRLKRDEAVEYIAAPSVRAPRRRVPLLRRADRRRRLTLTIARTAALEFDAVIANGCRVTGFTKDGNGHVNGADVEADGASFTIQAGSWSTPPACGPTTCAPSTRAGTPTRSAPRKASTSRCRGRRCRTESLW